MAEMPTSTTIIKCPGCGRVLELTLQVGEERPKELPPIHRPPLDRDPMVGIGSPVPGQHCGECWYLVEGKCNNEKSPHFGQEMDRLLGWCEAFNLKWAKRRELE